MFFDRPFFDDFFFNEMPKFSFFGREARKAQRPSRPGPPVYPPIDPFGTTEYIPLPGPSNPAHALPLANDNPHFHKPQRFRRPFY